MMLDDKLTQKILGLLYNDNQSKAELCTETGLDTLEMTIIINEMIDNGWIKKAEENTYMLNL